MSTFCWEGFDMYNGFNTGTGLQARWTGVIQASGGLVTGRFGGQAIKALSSNGQAFAAQLNVGGSTPTSFAFGMAFQIASIGNVGIQHTVKVRNGGTTIIEYGLDPTNGNIAVYNSAGTLLGVTANGLWVAGAWNYLEAEVVCSATVGTVNLYLNGTSVLTATGLNTGTLGLTNFFITNSAGNAFTSDTLYVDDLYFTDSATKLGECKVETLRPTADAITETWTPNSGVTNFSRVNETLVDGDTSFVATATVGNKDLYSIGSLSSTPASIIGISVVGFEEKTDATTRTLYHSVRSGATDSDGSAFSLNSTYQRYDRYILTDPDTSAAWTASGVNNLLIGPKLAS